MASQLIDHLEDGICENPVFDIFSSPKKNGHVVDICDLYLLPAAVCRPESRNLTFMLEAQNNYLWLPESRFEVDLQIKKAGQDLPAPAAGNAEGVGRQDSAGFDNLIGANIIKNLQLFANDELISSGSETYGISAYVISILGLTKDQIDHKAEHWGMTWEKSPNNTSFLSQDGYRTRLLRSMGSGIVRISCPLFVNLFLCGKMYLPMSPLKFEIQLQSPGYVIKSGMADQAGLDYVIANPRLLFRRVKVSSEFQIAQEKRLLSRGHATYIVPHFQTRQFICPAGAREWRTPDVFGSSFLPNMCYVFMSNHNDSIGTTNSSVFSFRHFSVSEVSLMMGDTPLIQEFDFTENKYLAGWRRFLNETWSEAQNNIDVTCWLDQHFFVAFDLNKISCMNQPRQLASCELKINFSVSTNALLKIYVFSCEDGKLTVTPSRKWTRHF